MAVPALGCAFRCDIGLLRYGSARVPYGNSDPISDLLHDFLVVLADAMILL